MYRTSDDTDRDALSLVVVRELSKYIALIHPADVGIKYQTMTQRSACDVLRSSAAYLHKPQRVYCLWATRRHSDVTYVHCGRTVSGAIGAQKSLWGSLDVSGATERFPTV